MMPCALCSENAELKHSHVPPAADPARQRYAAALDALEARFAGRILTVSGRTRNVGDVERTGAEVFDPWSL